MSDRTKIVEELLTKHVGMTHCDVSLAQIAKEIVATLDGHKKEPDSAPSEVRDAKRPAAMAQPGPGGQGVHSRNGPDQDRPRIRA